MMTNRNEEEEEREKKIPWSAKMKTSQNVVAFRFTRRNSKDVYFTIENV